MDVNLKYAGRITIDVRHYIIVFACVSDKKRYLKGKDRTT
jgi:hypothetical protein